MRFELQVNGRKAEVDVEEDTPLLWVLRDSLGLTGAKYGCGIAACGACTVHLDGEPMRSCAVPIAAVGQSAITTIEGLAQGEALHPLQTAWIEAQVPQCGYCQTGFIMAGAALLKANPNPTEDAIKAELTNICRCGTYPRMVGAILAAAKAGA